MDNQHKQISGYRDLSQDEINAMNEIKGVEATVGALWRNVNALAETDKRWAAIARTHLEEGFSALIRSVAKPEPRF